MGTNADKINTIRRAGFYAKGLVYTLIGALAAMAAFNLGGEISGRSGIVEFLQELPAGILLVGVVAVGLLAYSVWRFYEAIFDPQANASDGNRTDKRFTYAYSGLVYLFVAYSFAQPVVDAIFGGGGSSGKSTKKAALAGLLDTEWGLWAVAVIGIALVIMALRQFYRGYRGKYMKKIDDHPGDQREYQLVKKSGKIGYLARGVVFGILAFFVFQVMAAHNADEFKGTEGALRFLLEQPYGPILMGAVAMGLLGYGIFCFMVAWHSNMTNLD